MTAPDPSERRARPRASEPDRSTTQPPAARSLDDLVEAVLARPKEASLHLDLARRLHRLGHPDAARRAFRHAERLRPGHRELGAAAEELFAGPRPADFTVGDLLTGADGRYVVQTVLRGGHGVVLVVDVEAHTDLEHVGARLVLKTFPRRMAPTPAEAARFEREALTWLELEPHPHVVRALGVEMLDTGPALCLEYLPRGHLGDVLAGRPRPIGWTMHYAWQLCAAMEHVARRHSLVHGDLKPANCLIGPNEVLKLGDFGLAQPRGPAPAVEDATDGLPRSVVDLYRVPLGTAGYRAPEQAQGQELDTLTDVYAFGIVLHELLTGTRPPSGEIAAAHVRAHPAPPGTPEQLTRLVESCVSRDAAARPQGFQVVRGELEEVYARAVGPVPPPAAPAARDVATGTVDRAVGLSHLGHHAQAVELLEGLVADRPDQERAMVHLGAALRRVGRLDDAHHWLVTAHRRRPHESAATLELAAVLRLLGRAGEAVELLDDDSDPDPADVARGLETARALAATGRVREALARLDAIRRDAAEHPEVLGLSGRLRNDVGDVERAEADLRRVHGLDPNDVEAAAELGRCCAADGRYDEAVSWFDPVPDATLDTLERRIAYATALRRTGRADDASEQLRRAAPLVAGAADPAGLRVRVAEIGGAEMADEMVGPVGPGADDPAPPPGPEEPFTDAVRFGLAFARLEARAAGIPRVSRAHLLLGAAKLCDSKLSALPDLSPEALVAVELEVADVRGIFEDAQVGLTAFRRALRVVLAPARPVQVDGVLRRSTNARRVFDAALDAARADGAERARLVHLVRTVLAELVDRDRPPADTLAALAAAVREALRRAPAEAVSETGAGAVAEAGTALERFGRDLTALARQGLLRPVIGREDLVARLAGVLAKEQKSNPLLVGEPGVGKTAIVEALATAIAGADPPAGLESTRIVEVSMAALVAGAAHAGEFERRILGLMAEAAADARVVLFVDEVHTVLGAGGSPGGLDAANVLKPALARGELRVIGATTGADHRRYVDKDRALARRFQVVVVPEPSEGETATILRGLRGRLESHHGVQVTDAAIEAAITLSRRHQPSLRLPDKAVDLLDWACSHVRRRGGTAPRTTEAVGEADVAAALSSVAGATPAGAAGDVGEVLADRVLGQPDAVRAAVAAVDTFRAGLHEPGGPAARLLLAGPPGTGKTEMGRALAQAVSGSPHDLVHIDLGDYTEGHAVSRLLGAPPGYIGHDDDGPLLGPIRARPHGVVLFDNADRAHRRVVEIVLSIVDQGSVTDAAGRVVSFADAIVVLAVTTGTDRRVPVGFAGPADGDRSSASRTGGIDREVRAALGGGVVDRFDVLFFHPFDRDGARVLVERFLTPVRDRFGARGQELRIDDAVHAAILDEGVDADRGARGLQAAVHRLVTAPAREALVSGAADRAPAVELVLVDGEPVLRTGAADPGAAP